MYGLIQWFVKITGWPVQFFAFRKKIYYENKKRQGRRIKGKAIIISNHQSLMDFPLIMYTFPLNTLRCQMAEVLYKKNFLLSFFLKIMGGIKVDRDARDFSFINKSLKILQKGGIVEIFPEARLPKVGEKRPLPFKVSAAYIALQSGAPVIPVYISGDYFGKKGMNVMVGTPIDVTQFYDSTLDEKQNLAAISDKLRDRIIWLKNELDEQTRGKEE